MYIFGCTEFLTTAVVQSINLKTMVGNFCVESYCSFLCCQLPFHFTLTICNYTSLLSMTILCFFPFTCFTSECPEHEIHNCSVQCTHSTFPSYPLKDENLLLMLSLIRALSFQINDPVGLDKLGHSCLTKIPTSVFTTWTRNQVNITGMDTTNSQHSQHYKANAW